MALVFAYAAGIAGLLWYNLAYLPFPELTQNFAFALNIVLFGVLSLLSFLVYRQELHFRSIFFNFWIFFSVNALSAPIVYHFRHWEGPEAGVGAYVLVRIVVRVIAFWITAHIVFSYIFRSKRRMLVDILTALVVIPLAAWVFWPYYWHPAAILDLPTALDQATLYQPIQRSIIIINSVALATLLAFFLHKFRTDKPIGAYADTLLYFFGIFVTVDTVEAVANVSSLELLHMTQWANGLLIAAMILTLMLRLKYKNQTIAHYYESQCLVDNPRIDRRIGAFDRFILRHFFDSEKIGQRIFLGTRGSKVVKNHPAAPRKRNGAEQLH